MTLGRSFSEWRERVDLASGQVVEEAFELDELPDLPRDHTALMLPSGVVAFVPGRFPDDCLGSSLRTFALGAEPPLAGHDLLCMASTYATTLLATGTPWLAGSSPPFAHRLETREMSSPIDLGNINPWPMMPPFPGLDIVLALVGLPSGELLIHTASGALRFNPATRTSAPEWGFLPDFGTPNVTMTALMDGRMLVLGGLPMVAAVYDPGANTLDPTAGAPGADRFGHTATLVPDGTVFIAGGAAGSPPERYEPSTGMFTSLELTVLERRDHAAVLASDGRVWLFGGCDGSCPAEAYHPGTGTLEVIDAPDVGRPALAVGLLDGNILVGSSSGLVLFDVASGSATLLGTNIAPSQMLALPTGRVLLLHDDTELSLLDPRTSTVVPVLSFDPLPFENEMALMSDGGVFFSHCFEDADLPEANACLWYESTPPDPSWRPTLATPGTALSYGETSTLAGDNLLGLYEATDTPGAARSNHPVAVFMPFGGAPSMEAFHDWTPTSARYTPTPAVGGPGYLFSLVAGQIGGTYATVVPAADGAPCTSDGGCHSAICADGVCCAGVCGACEACAAALKAGGTDGVCGPATAGSDPHDDCAEEDVFTCGLDGTCDGTGQCAAYPEGTICDEGRACRDGACTDACTSNEDCPEGYACVDDRCAEACGSDDECEDGFACFEGVCRDRCTSNAHCADGLVCAAEGTCGPALTAAEPLGCAPCTTSRQTGDAAGWWLVAGALALWRRRRSAGPPAAS